MANLGAYCSPVMRDRSQVSDMVKAILQAIDDPRLVYILLPHWATYLEGHASLGNVEARPLTPMNGSGGLNKPLIMEGVSRTIDARRDYLNALSRGYDALIYVNQPRRPVMVLEGDYTMARVGLNAKIPILALDGSVRPGRYEYSMGFRRVEFLTYDILVIKDGDVDEWVVLGFDAGKVFMGSCSGVGQYVDAVLRLAREETRLNYAVLISMNDSWGNPRNPPIHWGFSTWQFTARVLGKVTEGKAPLAYIYLDESSGGVRANWGLLEALSSMGYGNVDELQYEDSPITVIDHEGYWALAIGSVDELFRVLKIIEDKYGEFKDRVIKYTADRLREVLEPFGEGDLAGRVNELNVREVRSIIFKYLYMPDSGTVARVNMLRPGGFREGVDIVTGETHVAGAWALNEAYWRLNEVKDILTR